MVYIHALINILPFIDRSSYVNSTTPLAETSLTFSPTQCNRVTASDSPMGMGIMHPLCTDGVNYQPNVQPFHGAHLVDLYDETTSIWNRDPTHPQLLNISFAIVPTANSKIVES